MDRCIFKAFELVTRMKNYKNFEKYIFYQIITTKKNEIRAKERDLMEIIEQLKRERAREMIMWGDGFRRELGKEQDDRCAKQRLIDRKCDLTIYEV